MNNISEPKIIKRKYKAIYRFTFSFKRNTSLVLKERCLGFKPTRRSF